MNALKFSISMRYDYKQVPTKVSKVVADGIDRLKALSFQPRNILEVYLDAQKLAKKRARPYHPMRFMAACNQSTNETTVPYYRDLESVYNEIVKQWHKIVPEDFMEQYEAYLYQRHSESGWENGLLCWKSI